MHNYFIFLDYLELRRRIEKRLATVNWLLLHSILFVVVTGLLLMTLTAGTPNFYTGYFILPPIGYAMTAWSVLLLLHTFWTYARSGATASRRNEMIEREMSERVQNEDTYLSDNPKDLFRIYGLLEEDIQKRAAIFNILRIFATLNMIVWLGSALRDGLTSSFAWQSVIGIGLAFLPVLAFNAWQRSRHEGRVRKLLSSATPADEQPEPLKNDRLLRLADDGELVDYEVDKPKRSSEEF